MVCSNKVSILYSFRNIATFAVYVTYRELEKSFSFDNEDSSKYKPGALYSSCVNISLLMHAIFSKVQHLERFQTAKVTLKITQGQGHLRSLVLFCRLIVASTGVCRMDHRPVHGQWLGSSNLDMQIIVFQKLYKIQTAVTVND